MGKVMSSLGRRVNRWNVENRAHKILEKDKPIPAPKYESNLKDIQRTLEEIPDLSEQISKKDMGLDDRLKQVYVTSTDILTATSPKQESVDRQLPTDTSRVMDFEYGYKDPDKVPRGKITLKQAIQFMSDHSSEPQLWTEEKIADHYRLKLDIVQDVLTHFRMFRIYIPSGGTGKKQQILTQPSFIQRLTGSETSIEKSVDSPDTTKEDKK